jgi:hypothetical protein
MLPKWRRAQLAKEYRRREKIGRAPEKQELSCQAPGLAA